MSDHDDPTAQRPVGGEGTTDEPTSVMRTPADEPTAVARTPPAQPPRAVRTTTTETVPADRRPPAGVSTGAAVAGAIAALLIGLLLGFLLFDSDDDSETATTDTATDAGDAAALRAERDELMGLVAERDGQIEELQADLDERTAERDDLQSQLDEAGDQPATVPAPDVVGGSADDARDVAGDNGWTLVEREAGDAPDEAEPGTVVDQSPEPGTPMTEGSVLVIDVVQEPEGE